MEVQSEPDRETASGIWSLILQPDTGEPLRPAGRVGESEFAWQTLTSRAAQSTAGWGEPETQSVAYLGPLSAPTLAEAQQFPD